MFPGTRRKLYVRPMHRGAVSCVYRAYLGTSCDDHLVYLVCHPMTHMLMWAPKKSVHASSAIQEWPSFFRSAYALKQLELNIICMPFWALNVQRCSEIQCKDIEPPGDSQRAAPCREQLPCAVHHRAIHCLNTCTYHPSYRHCSSVPCCSLGNVYGSPAAGHSPAQ